MIRALIRVISIALKELRELVRRPLLVVTLILGPLAIILAFGIGSETFLSPPTAIVVMPPGQERPRLLQDYQRQFEQSLRVIDYTTNLEYAQRQLRRNRVNAVVILPPTPYETIAGGQQAEIRVLYNEIDPARRWAVPEFLRSMASEINREIFLQDAREQQESLAASSREIDLALEVLDRTITAVERGNREEARKGLRDAQTILDRLGESLNLLGAEDGALQVPVERARDRLEEGEQRLGEAENVLATPDPRPPSEQLGLAQTRRDLERLQQTLERFRNVPPEVAISPIGVEAEYTAQLRPDTITFFAPAMLALLIQHTAVSLGALAMVSERLAQTFELYIVAPVSNLQLLLGKYLAYVLFTLSITAVLVGMLLGPFHVPVFGSPWRMLLTLLLLSLTSVGLGFALSLAATSERQAVQFAMLSLLAIVFFSGIALPLDSLRMPALLFSYALPATYGASVLQDVMLRGLPGSTIFLVILVVLAATLFAICLGLLHWRTRPV